MQVKKHVNRSATHLPVLVKGILTAEDALLAVQHGAKGVIVSNHGGRQLDSTLATVESYNSLFLKFCQIDALAAIAPVMKNRCELYMDGGIRTGNDVFKALGLGAKAVFVGRPVVWALACEVNSFTA